MSYGYGGRPNPFDQRDDNSGGGSYGGPARGPPQAAFGQGPRPGGGYGQGPSMGRGNYGSSNVEMSSLTQNAGAFASGDPNAILNECRSIDKGIDLIEQNLNQLRMLQDRSLNADTSSSTSLDSLSSETMSMYRELTNRVRQMKSQPDAQQPKNAPQVGRVDRRLKQAIQSFQQVESAFRKKTQDQMARQYRIVRPDATEFEVRQVVEDTSSGGQVFQQAMMQSSRRGEARAVLSAVQDRHAALQKIEQQMIELAQLFQDMDTLVIQQEAQVVQIEQKGEEVVENLDKGNEEIAVAVTTARKTRKKKWICLGICVAIIVIVAVAVTAYVLINKQANGSKKRDLEGRSVIEWDGEAPVAAVYAQSKIVVPAQADDPAPLARFAGAAQISKTAKRYVKIGQNFDADGEDKRSALPGGVYNDHSGSSNIAKRYIIDFTPPEAEDEGDSAKIKRMLPFRIGVPVPPSDENAARRYTVPGDFDESTADKRRVRVGVPYSGGGDEA